jgi:lipid-binding SYLF domain-containing protein
MNRKHVILLAASVFAAIASTAFADSNSVSNLKKAAGEIPKEKDGLSVQSALVEFEKVDQMTAYFENCYGVAVFPTIAKGGLGVGGSHGAGWVFRQGDYTGMVKMTQVTVGWQAGGQAYSQVIFFENEATYLNFTSGEFEFGAQASAVAITAGASASASTAGGATAGAGSSQAKLDYTGGMAVFTVAKGGLMYEAALGGQKFKFYPAK